MHCSGVSFGGSGLCEQEEEGEHVALEGEEEEGPVETDGSVER